jgi:predicted O-methyltransferase YrrM
MNIDPAILKNVKGFLDEEEGRRLYETGRAASRRGPCLEVGSYCGKSTLYLGAACRENGSVLFSIDHHRGSEEQQPGEEYFDPELMDSRIGRIDTFFWFRQTIERSGLEDTVVPIVCRSELAARAWATPLQLVFIDGGHSLETARADYDLWSPHIVSGGYLLIHDIFTDPSEGGQAPREVYLSALGSGRFEDAGLVKTLGVLRRR